MAPTRPITIGDFVNPATNLLAITPLGEGSIAVEGTELAAAESDTFVILSSELPPKFDTTWPIGRYSVPANAAPGTTTYGHQVGDQIGKLFRDALPDVKVILRTDPGIKGVDIEIPSDAVIEAGFRYAEIKPISAAAVSRFNIQVMRWNLPEPVQVITYDYEGNIYYGFPW
jgi:hypothetical protein